MSQKTFITPAYDSILEIKTFSDGRPIEDLTREYGFDEVLKLASNENPLGCSPYVTLAITKQLNQLARYPDHNGYYLRAAIADFTKTSMDKVTLGNGSNDLLDIIARTFVSSDDAIIYSQYAFVVYSMIAKMIGATGIEVPAKRYGHDLDAMLQVVKDTPNARLVFVSNPNNPTGTLLSHKKIHEFVSQVPSHVLIVLDEAYVEYSPESNNRAILDDFDNVIIARTFSKAYGLAGLRVGYTLSHPKVANMINRIRQPYNVNLLAQVAAMAALKDQDFIADAYEMTEGQRRWLYKQFDALGLEFVRSAANFVMVNVGDAQSVYQSLLEQGIVVSPLTAYGLPEWLRITVGMPEDNTHLIDSLTSVLS